MHYINLHPYIDVSNLYHIFDTVCYKMLLNGPRGFEEQDLLGLSQVRFIMLMDLYVDLDLLLSTITITEQLSLSLPSIPEVDEFVEYMEYMTTSNETATNGFLDDTLFRQLIYRWLYVCTDASRLGKPT